MTYSPLEAPARGSRRGWVVKGVALAVCAALFLLFFYKEQVSGAEVAVLFQKQRADSHASLQSIAALVEAANEKLEAVQKDVSDLKSKLRGQDKGAKRLEAVHTLLAKFVSSELNGTVSRTTDCDGFHNEYTAAFASVLTRGLDWRAYCEARKAGTDKVQDHAYQYVYSKYLSQMANEPLLMLEIGLGCDMSYGPGKSLKMWRSLLPKSRISFMEFDEECAEKYRAAVEKEAGGKLYPGDQADPALLKQVVDDTASLGLYDLIIDDGGHNPTAQLLSLEGLWPALKSGGVYVVEDVQTHFFRPNYLPRRYKPLGPRTFMDWVPRMTRLVHCHAPMFQFYSVEAQAACNNATQLEKEVLTIECQAEACVLVKR